jgi:hypothetical protein
VRVNSPSSSTASHVAYLAAALNAAAGLAMLVLLRPGLPGPGGASAAERLVYLQADVALWWGGWIIWHAAAIALLALYLALALRWGRDSPLRCGLALMCAAAGLACDLSAQALWMGLGPRVGERELALVEAAAALLTGYLANGLYTLAGILLTWAGAVHLPRPLFLLALPVWGAGVGLSGASLAGWPLGQVVATGVLLPLVTLWAAAEGRWLQRQPS